MSKFLALLCLIAAALFIGGTVADTCLSYPGPLGRGAGCGGFLPCRQGLACSEEGVCVPRTREGEDCEDIPCEAGLSCMGPEDARRCVAPVHPGQDCVQSNGYSGPRCGTGYCDDGRCRGGMIGDACYEDDDCSGDLTCTERICTGLAVGAECTDTSSCVVGSYCHSVTGVCTALPTSGNCTLFTGQCAYGYSCINPSDEALFPQCVAHSSIPDGGYCDGNRDVCLNKRCYDDYCAAASPKYCDNSYQCAGDEACTCGGDSKLSGIGSCKAVACTKHFKAYDDCFSQNCRADTYFNGSCIQRNCDAEYRKNEICSSASSLFVSLLSASFFALFVSFLGKHF